MGRELDGIPGFETQRPADAAVPTYLASCQQLNNFFIDDKGGSVDRSSESWVIAQMMHSAAMPTAYFPDIQSISQQATYHAIEWMRGVDNNVLQLAFKRPPELQLELLVTMGLRDNLAQNVTSLLNAADEAITYAVKDKETDTDVAKAFMDEFLADEDYYYRRIVPKVGSYNAGVSFAMATRWLKSAVPSQEQKTEYMRQTADVRAMVDVGVADTLNQHGLSGMSATAALYHYFGICAGLYGKNTDDIQKSLIRLGLPKDTYIFNPAKISSKYDKISPEMWAEVGRHFVYFNDPPR